MRIVFRNGRGNFKFENGNHYYGDWLDNKRHGTGKMTFGSGSVYDGKWKEDKRWVDVRCGRFGVVIVVAICRLVQRITTVVHALLISAVAAVASTRQGRPLTALTHYHSSRIPHCVSLTTPRSPLPTRHGKGSYTYANGDKYVGHFDEGLFHGYGVFSYQNQDSYAGYWKAGQRHGENRFPPC